MMPAPAPGTGDPGVEVEYMVAADEGHSFDRRGTKTELMTRAARFLDEAFRSRGSTTNFARETS